MNYLDVCTGIGAASVAWRNSFGWNPIGFSEIEPFPCTVLKHRFPNVPNFGDMRKFKEWPVERGTVGLLVGGTPCQSFSIAGLRGGLEDDRGNLMLIYGAIAAHFRPTWLLWENVPGVLSSKGGLDFASFLGLLTGRKISVPVGGWRNSGILAGIPDAYGVAWASLDAQYFGVPQRRERVFVIGYLGDWRRAAAVLFESESVQRHNPPIRETGKTIAPTLAARTKGGGELGTDFDLDGGLQVLDARGNGNGNDVNTLTGDHASRPTDYTPLIFDTTQITSKANFSNPKPGDPSHPLAAGAHPPAIAMTLNAKGGSGSGSGRIDAESETFVVGTLQARGKATGSATQQDAEAGLLITHSLRGEGFDASEDGTGRGVPLVPFTFESRYARNGRGAPSEIVPALTAQAGQTGKGDAAPLVAFDTKASGRNGFGVGDQSPTLRSMNGARANGGGQVGVSGLQGVRRLTPVECERLQEFPDGWTKIPTWNGWRKMGADETPEQLQDQGFEVRQNKKTGRWSVKDVDGPRYRALGNSMHTGTMRWIGERIAKVDSW